MSEAKKAGKVYESAARNQRVGVIRFSPQAAVKFGILRPDDATVQRKTGLTEEQIIAEVEATSAYKTGIVGRQGIWLMEDRVTQDTDTKLDGILSSLVALGEPALRKKLADAGVAAPVSATVEELAQLALQAISAGKKGKGKKKAAADAAGEDNAPLKPSLRRGAQTAKDFDPTE